MKCAIVICVLNIRWMEWKWQWQMQTAIVPKAYVGDGVSVTHFNKEGWIEEDGAFV